DAGMVLADGAPVAWAAGSTRIAGSDVFAELCRRSTARSYRHFLLGSTDETLELLRGRLAKTYPGLRVRGPYSPPFRPALEELAPEPLEGGPQLVGRDPRVVGRTLDGVGQQAPAGDGARRLDLHGGRCQLSRERLEIGGEARHPVGKAERGRLSDLGDDRRQP